MSDRLPKQRKLIPISETAKILGVSIDTVRRWDKSGVLHSERPDGKNRYFSLNELETHKSLQPVPISEAAIKLGVSAVTLRRLEARGLLKPNRNSAGERVYTKDSLNEFLNSDYFLRKNMVKGEESKPQQPEKLERPNLKPPSYMPVFLTITVAVFLLLVTFGIGNIKLTEAKNSQLASIPTVLSVQQTSPPEVKSEATSSAVPEIKIVIVQIGESAEMVNIHEKPTLNSKIIGLATDADRFEFVSLDSNWYQIKSSDGSTGFIPAQYLIEEETNN